jgi:hypothetical protein
MTTIPLSVTKKRWRSASRSKPMTVPEGISTSLSMMARRIFAWRPTRTRSKRTLSSTSLKEFTRQPTPRTLRWMRPPEMMQPWLTMESVAMPTRACASSRKTNFAGGSCVAPVRMGQRKL